MTILFICPKGYDGGPKQDAKELAKKLLKSGAISAIKPPDKEKQGFKRSISLQRKKLEQADKPKYQPFSAVQKWDSDIELEVSGPKGNVLSGVPIQEKEAFAREATFREKKRDGKAHYINRDIPNVGNTIYVYGIGVNEQMLRSGFAPYGNILNVTVEYTRNCGFITFETIDEANKAIDSMNNTQLKNVQLKVTLARKQPMISKSASQSSTDSQPSSQMTVQTLPPPPTPQHHSQPVAASVPSVPSTLSTGNSKSANNTVVPTAAAISISTPTTNPKANQWSSIAASSEQKPAAPPKDKRTLIAYDDIY